LQWKLKPTSNVLKHWNCKLDKLSGSGLERASAVLLRRLIEVLSRGYVPIMLVTGAATRVYLAISATDMRSFQRNLVSDLMFGIRLCVLTDAMICRKVVSAAQKCWQQFMSSDAGSYENGRGDLRWQALAETDHP
jgi:hypothetical protein